MGRHHVLTDQQVEQYSVDGYTTAHGVMAAGEFVALQEYFERRFAALEAGQRPEDMDVPHFEDPKVFRWLLNSEILDMVEDLIGPDIAVFSSHFFCKAAGDGKSVPWHEDAYFWQDQIAPAVDALTVWLALDPSTRENGCLQVVPGSQNRHIGQYDVVEDPGSVFDEGLRDFRIDAAEVVPVELAPSELSIHNAGLVHGSAANTSPLRRCGFTMRYMSTHVKFNHIEASDYHQIYLARGTDRAGNTYADPTQAFPELVRNRAARHITHMN